MTSRVAAPPSRRHHRRAAPARCAAAGAAAAKSVATATAWRRLAERSSDPRLARRQPADRTAGRHAATSAPERENAGSAGVACRRCRAHDRPRRGRRSVGALQARRTRHLHPAPLHRRRGRRRSTKSAASIAPIAEFRQTVEQYIQEFERLLDDVSRGDRGTAVARNYLTSDTGKVYTMLAHAAGRFD